MNRKASAALAAGACAAAAAMTSVYAADLIYRTATARVQPLLTREKPCDPEKLDPISRRRLELMDELEHWEGGETVEITSHDGLKLKGHWFAAEKPRRIVIMVHGWRSSWARDFGMCADFFREEGCSLLLIEQRSHGQSEGKYIGFGVLERHDCLRWLHYVRTRFGEQLPIYLFGISMGAATVLMASGFSLPACVHGIIADCGFTSPKEIFRHIARNKSHSDLRLLLRTANWISSRRAGYRLDEYSTLEAMKVNKTPILFIHGTADNFVPMDMTMQNYHACRAEKSLLLIDGAPHARSYLVAMDEYQSAIRKFFRKYDK